MTGARRIVVLTAGVSDPSSSRRLADRLAEAAARALADRGEAADVTTIEVKALAHDAVDATVGGVTSTRLADALDAVTGADGLVAVSPVFNGSVAGLFKSFVDLLPQRSLEGVPAAIGVTGGSDRHSLVLDHALRPVLSHLHAAVVPTAVHASGADLAGGARSAVLDARIERAGRELAALVSLRPSRDEADAELQRLLTRVE